MTTVFDPLRMSAVSLDVMAVNRDSAQGVARRQQARLALLLDAALAGSRLYRQLLAARTTARTPLQDLPVVTRGHEERIERIQKDLARVVKTRTLHRAGRARVQFGD